MEIGVNVGSEENKAIMTERVITAYFSHPSVNGIYAWTLLPAQHEKGEGRMDAFLGNYEITKDDL